MQSIFPSNQGVKEIRRPASLCYRFRTRSSERQRNQRHSRPPTVHVLSSGVALCYENRTLFTIPKRSLEEDASSKHQNSFGQSS